MMAPARKILHHTPRALTFLTGSAGAQGIAALTGLFLARWLSVPDYALFTVMITLISAMNILTKGGAHYGFAAILGKVWPDRERTAQAVVAVLQIRRKLSLWTLPPVLVAAGWLLHKNGASSGEIIGLCTLLFVIWWADMQTRLVDQVLFHAHQTTRVQLLDTSLAALRLAGAGLLFLLNGLSVLPAICLSAATALARIPLIRKWVAKIAPLQGAAAQPEDISALKTSVRQQLPVEIYMVLQAQIILVLLTIFGTGTEVASFGALGRIGQILVPVTMFTTAFLIPIYTRATGNLATLLFGLTLLSALPGLGFIVLTYLYPHAVLWLIGENYAGLQTEVIWAVGVSVAMRLATTYRNLVGSRGWIRFNILQIPLFILWILAAPLLFDLSTLIGAFQLQLGFAVIITIAASVDFIFARHAPPSAKPT
ncbi:hypothetical protein K3X44_13820 [Aliiroseovarius crassostreae]|uniref:hypothetical protein n=1 Tax=Aliiroseovarius crassostreae TaxID=154981 RepID=UPI002206E162|nr:hypothetical protein [Aliiroseovarius crassostreae]UWQ01519.1 hypothetical protein K3X44_13820 [Aliiroseovarius crassostreae]